MKTVKLTSLFLVVALAIVTFIQCNNSTEKPRVYVLLKNIKNPFFDKIEQGIKSTKKDVEIIIKSGSSESDVSSQVEYLHYISNDLKVNKNEIIWGVIITPSSSGNDLIPYMVKIREAKIPIILVDTRIDSGLLVKNNLQDIPFIGSSNEKGGEQAAELLVDTLSEKSNILILNGVAGQETAFQRNKGFHSIIDKTKFTVTERIANWSFDEAFKSVSSLINSGYNFDGIFAANDMMALGALQAYKIDNKKIPIIIGFDAVDDAVKSVNNGDLYATIAQDPYEMGKKAIELVIKMNNNQVLDSLNYLIETKIIKK